ncbi:MAG: thioesterase II family protein [Desulfovibrionaceae bacterium]
MNAPGRDAGGAPALTLVALPFAGGGAAGLAPLVRRLEGAVRVLALDPPGHGPRIREPLLDRIEALAADALVRARAAAQAGPWALFGHSMGGLVAHRLAVLARREGLPGPVRLFLAACSAPGRARLPAALLEPDSAAFWRAVDRYDGLPKGFLAYPELMTVFEPILRADFRAVAAYRPADLPVLDLPFSLLTGRDDPLGAADLEGWQALTTRPLDRRAFPGGHFFPLREAEAVARCLLDDCRCPVG